MPRMTHLIVNQTRALLGAPLRVGAPTTTLGRAVILYLALVIHANDHGLVIRKSSQLADDLSVPEDAIQAWVTRLSNVKLVEILSPVPYLTVRLGFWSAAGLPAEEHAGLSAKDKESSNGRQSSAAAISFSSKGGDGGQGEGELRGAIQTMLPEADGTEIERILDRYPRAIIRKAVERVNNAGRIRKSKTALFRFLLAKFSETIDVRDL